MARRLVLVVATMALILAGRTAVAAVTKAINYQAVLTSGGVPVTGATNVTFRIYDAATAGASVWTEARSVTPDAQGRLSLRLGEVSAIDEAVFNGQDRWLGVTVSGDAEMNPRLPLASSSYSFRVATLDGAKAGTITGDLRIAASAASEKDATMAEARVVLISLAGDSVIIGPAGQIVFKAVDNSGNTEMSATIDPTLGPVLSVRDPGGNHTEHSGNSSSYYGNLTKDANALQKRVEVGADGVTVYNPDGTAMMRVNPSTGQVAATSINVGPDLTLMVNKNAAAVCGAGALSNIGSPAQLNNALGPDNDLAGASSSFSVGACNTVDNTLVPPTQYVSNATAFGERNFVGSNQSFVAGYGDTVGMGSSNMVIFGTNNMISTGNGTQSSTGSSILGGQQNYVYGPANTIASGAGNRVTSSAGNLVGGSDNLIGGGNENRISGSSFSFIAGGERNIIDIDSNGGVPFNHAVIGGGGSNRASNASATIGGGQDNRAKGNLSTIGGGNSNEALGTQSTIAGGSANNAGPGNGTVVAGGESNTASGSWSTVPGGISNIAAGARSFAAGSGAQANHDGAFVWSDPNGAFSSTGNNQFLIQATGNVGINTNSPSQPLTVAGTIYTTSGGIKFPDGSVQSSAATSITDGWTDDGTTVRLTAGTDNVGIGTSTPSEKLEVSGNLKVSGNVNLVNSASAAGNILKSGTLFIHNYGTNNTFVGLGAGNLAMTGLGMNTALGANTLSNNTSGSGNTASGKNALSSNTTGYDNTANGIDALTLNTIGHFNTASGAGALASNSTGHNNTASGQSALPTNTTGFKNTASGASALYLNATGNRNTACGAGALLFNTAGNNNSAFGDSALYDNTTGSNNTAVGYGADVATGALTNATAIGAIASVSASNTMVLGNSSVLRWGFGVDAEAGHAIQVGTLLSSGGGAYLTSGGVWTNGSDRNSKEGITLVDAGELLQKVNRLPVYRWNYKGEDPSHQHVGPMAQDFYAVFGVGDDDKHISTIDPAGVALAAIQALQKKLQELEGQRSEIEQLRQQVAELQKLVEKLASQR